MATGLRRSFSGQLIQIEPIEQQPVTSNENQIANQEIIEESAIEISSYSLRSIMLYEFKLGTSASQCLKKLKLAFGDDKVKKSTIYKFYQKFKKGNFNLKDEQRSGRRSKLSDDHLKELISFSPKINVEELAKLAEVSPTTIRNHLHSLGYTYI